MTQRVRVVGGALGAWLWVAAMLLGLGCHKAVKPEAGADRTVETGTPVAFGSEAPGAPAVTWDFGDGSPAHQGPSVSHAFARPGRFAVRALEKDAVLASAQVTVVARPVLRAIPDDAEVAVFFPEVKGNVEPVLDFFSRMLGEEQTRQGLESIPLLSLLLEEVRGEPKLVNVEQGAGFFSLPGFEGSVALMGVLDTTAAQDAIVKELAASGVTVTQREPDGGALLKRSGGSPMILFADRGYLYLAVPSEPSTEAPVTAEATGGSEPVSEPSAPPAGPKELEALRTRVRSMTGPGLSELPLLTTLRSKVAAGNLQLFARPDSKEVSETFQGAWASLKAQGNEAQLEGWVSSDTSFFKGGRTAGSALLEKAPAGPIAAMTLSLAPEDLSGIAFGQPGSERREKALKSLREEEKLDAATAEGLLNAFRGDVSVLAYFDAPAFYKNFIEGSRKPEPKGTLLLQAGLVLSEPVFTWVTGQLKTRGQSYEVSKEKGLTRLRSKAFGQPVEMVLTADRLTVQAGEPLGTRAQVNVGSALRERFGAEAFGPGHASLGVDVGRLRQELDADVPGVPAQQLPMARALVGTVMEQLPPVERVFMDILPEPGGGRFRIHTLLRSR